MADVEWGSLGLGLRSDQMIAEEHGLDPRRVGEARRRLGIPPAENRRLRDAIDWDEVDLGARPDTVIAKDLGVSSNAVRTARKRRNIPPFRPGLPWLTPEVLERVGTVKDQVLAAELDVSANVITKFRLEAGIPPCGLPAEREYRRGRSWLTPLVVARMGTVPDLELAEEVGRSALMVGKVRRELGIPSSMTQRWLTAEVIARMGNEADHLIARDLGLAGPAVAKMRRDLGIPPRADRFTKRPFVRREDSWLTDAVKERLGTISDAALGAELGLTGPTVGCARRKLGIPAAHPKPQRWLTPEVEAELGQVPDRELAGRLGIDPQLVSIQRRKRGLPPKRAKRNRRPWLTPPVRARMGTVPDHVLAGEVGRSTVSVGIARRELGIPAYRRSKPWLTDEVRALMGEVADGIIGQRFGRSRTVVSEARRQLGIAPAACYVSPESALDEDALVVAVVNQLADMKGSTPRALGAVLGVAAAHVTRVLESLERLGIVQRKAPGSQRWVLD